jgi:hypothetical protein
MTVHQCPRCALRYSFRTELEHHLREDHAPEVKAEEIGHSPEPAPALSTHQNSAHPDALVIASQTAAAVLGQPVGLSLSRGRSPTMWSGSRPGDAESSDGAHADLRATDRTPRPVSLMPRWVVVTVVATMVLLLGLGLLFG